MDMKLELAINFANTLEIKLGKVRSAIMQSDEPILTSQDGKSVILSKECYQKIVEAVAK